MLIGGKILFNKRTEKLRKLMAEKNIEALWVTQEENRYYLSGFTGDSGQLLVTATEQFLLTDGRFIEQAQKEAPDYQVTDIGNNFWGQMGNILAVVGIKKLSFEAQHLTYATYK